MVCVAAVHEEQLRWAVVLVVGQLLLANTAEVPEDNAPVVGAAAQDGGLVWVPCQRRHGVLVAFQGVHLLTHIAQIPQTNSLVGRGGGYNVLAGGVERQGVDGIAVAVARNQRCAVFDRLPHVYDLQGEVVRHTAHKALGDGVVLHVVDDLCVVRKPARRLDDLAASRGRLQVPQAHGGVLAARCQAARLMGVPRQTETLLLVTDKLKLGVHCSCGRKAVLGAVEDENAAIDTESGQDVRVLGLVARLVHLLRVVDALHNIEADRGRRAVAIGRAVASGAAVVGTAAAIGALVSIAANLAALLVVVERARVREHGDGHLGDLQVVGHALGCVGTEQQTVDARLLLLQDLDVGKPLCRESRPGEGVAGGDMLALSCSASAASTYLKIMS